MQSGAFQRLVVRGASLTVVLALGLPANLFAATTADAQSGRSTRPPVTQSKTPTAKKSVTKPTSTKTKRSYSASGSRARRARLARARSEARAREAREVQTPRFRIDELGQEVPDVRAEAAIIYNPETNQVLWESNAQDQRSIASITKVMTALVFIESGMPLTTPVSVVRSDVYR